MKETGLSNLTRAKGVICEFCRSRAQLLLRSHNISYENCFACALKRLLSFFYQSGNRGMREFSKCEKGPPAFSGEMDDGPVHRCFFSGKKVR